MIAGRVNKGDKFEVTRTTQFGKIVKETLTVAMIWGNRVVFDNGQEVFQTN